MYWKLTLLYKHKMFSKNLLDTTLCFTIYIYRTKIKYTVINASTVEFHHSVDEYRETNNRHLKVIAGVEQPIQEFTDFAHSRCPHGVIFQARHDQRFKVSPLGHLEVDLEDVHAECETPFECQVEHLVLAVHERAVGDQVQQLYQIIPEARVLEVLLALGEHHVLVLGPHVTGARRVHGEVLVERVVIVLDRFSGLGRQHPVDQKLHRVTAEVRRLRHVYPDQPHVFRPLVGGQLHQVVASGTRRRAAVHVPIVGRAAVRAHAPAAGQRDERGIIAVQRRHILLDHTVAQDLHRERGFEQTRALKTPAADTTRRHI